MKYYTKNLCAGLTVIVMLLSLLASCASGDNQNSADNTTSGVKLAENSNDTADSKTETSDIASELPKKDYGGYEFTMLGREDPHWGSIDLYAETTNAESVNDAIYARNLYAEERFNIKINAVFSVDAGGLAQKSINSGDDDYDLISIDLWGSADRLVAPGFAVDINTIPHINLDNPWWDQNTRSQLSIGGKLFMAMGDLTFVDKDGAFVYFFNKDLIADLVMENPYELVRNNKWTVDKAYEMAKSASIDLNSDGKINGEDRFGNFSEANVFYEAVLAADELFFKKDEKDLPYSDLLNERLLESIAKWGEFMIDRQTTMLSGDYLNAYPAIWDKQLEMLNNKQLLLVHTSISRASMLRSFDCNFGIIPMPKLNEYQENYANAVHPTCGTTLCIPISASDLERTGIIVEALTAKSYYTLKPAYYDITLKTKLSRDDESSEMLDIIFANRVYDLGRMYNWGDVSSVLIQLAHQKTLAYVSRIERKADKIQTDMENTIALFENQ